jgi:hypothetical protein
MIRIVVHKKISPVATRTFIEKYGIEPAVPEHFMLKYKIYAFADVQLKQVTGMAVF